VEKVSKFVNKAHAIYAYIITSEELGYMSHKGRKLNKIGTGITNGSKVVSREISHSVNGIYYRRLFGAKWKNYRVTCSLKYESFHLSIFATNHCL
jgi:hypothetical protein